MDILNRDPVVNNADFLHQENRNTTCDEVSSTALLLRPAVLPSAAPVVGDYVQLFMEQICACTAWPVGHVIACAGPKGAEKLCPSGLWHVDDTLGSTAVRQAVASALDGPTGARLIEIASKDHADWYPHGLNRIAMPTGNSREITYRVACAIPVRTGDETSLLLLFFSPESMPTDPRMLRAVSQLTTQLEKIVLQRRMASLNLGFRDFSLRLFRKFPAMIWRSGRDAKCDYFNDTWLQFTGRTLQEEIGDGWVAGVHPADLEGCLSTYTEAFRARLPFKMEYRLRHRDGQYRWLLDCGDPFCDLGGEFAGYIGCCYDATKTPFPEGSSQTSAT